MNITCKRCGKNWDYKGKSILATCPSCRQLNKAMEMPKKV